MNKIKKSKRRITSLLISAAMLISLTACSGQQRKVSDVTVKTSASSSAEESSQTSNHESSVWHPSTDNSDESSEVSAESQTESDISQAESDISQSESALIHLRLQYPRNFRITEYFPDTMTKHTDICPP